MDSVHSAREADSTNPSVPDEGTSVDADVPGGSEADSPQPLDSPSSVPDNQPSAVPVTPPQSIPAGEIETC